MLALEITQNGKKLLVANLQAVSGGFISADIGIHGQSGTLSVMGYTNPTDGHAPKMLNWKDGYQLSMGDELKIRLIDTSESSPPEKKKEMTEDD